MVHLRGQQRQIMALLENSELLAVEEHCSTEQLSYHHRNTASFVLFGSIDQMNDSSQNYVSCLYFEI